VTGDELVANLLAALRQRSHQPGNLKEILDGFGITRRQLERRFRLATGHSPLEALQQLRLDHALELLKDTNLPLEDVSAACGFSDVKHLRRVIRKATGKHPLAWRTEAGQATSAPARSTRLS
jgi:transcriptional regulator GlxA family with amidase domain